MITPKQFLNIKNEQIKILKKRERLEMIGHIDGFLECGLLDIYCSPSYDKNNWDEVLKEYEKIGWNIQSGDLNRVSFKFKNDKNTLTALAESELSEQTPE